MSIEEHLVGAGDFSITPLHGCGESEWRAKPREEIVAADNSSGSASRFQRMLTGATLASCSLNVCANTDPWPRDSVLLQTRSLTLGALIGAPTVREGLPSTAQHHTVGDLVP